MNASSIASKSENAGSIPSVIDIPPRLQAAEDLRRYLEKVDWSGLSSRRRQILEAFVSLASTSGYESVSMRKLGEAVNVKAPSIYKHFPNGRDEIVTEAFRWHFYRFASAMLEKAEKTKDVDSYWTSLVRAHLQRQLETPENDLWDILMATDRIARFLPDETRSEYYEWCSLYENMYVAAARELGYESDEVQKFVKVVVKVLDTAGQWCHWDGSQKGLHRCAEQAVAISRAIMTVDLSLSSSSNST